jgi:hypothetical protein
MLDEGPSRGRDQRAEPVAVLVLGVNTEPDLPADLEARAQAELARLLPTWRIALGEMPEALIAAPPVMRILGWVGDHLDEITPRVSVHGPGTPAGSLLRRGVSELGRRWPGRSRFH